MEGQRIISSLLGLLLAGSASIPKGLGAVMVRGGPERAALQWGRRMS